MNRSCPVYWCDYDGSEGWGRDWDDVLFRTRCPRCGTSVSKLELLCGKPRPIDCYQESPAVSVNQTLGEPDALPDKCTVHFCGDRWWNKTSHDAVEVARQVIVAFEAGKDWEIVEIEDD